MEWLTNCPHTLLVCRDRKQVSRSGGEGKKLGEEDNHDPLYTKHTLTENPSLIMRGDGSHWVLIVSRGAPRVPATRIYVPASALWGSNIHWQPKQQIRLRVFIAFLIPRQQVVVPVSAHSVSQLKHGGGGGGLGAKSSSVSPVSQTLFSSPRTALSQRNG
ncbi:unnamed protein product [Pleuronectes platessa]|uniref:Uncharacterized protein n=1 Tax=Pleuronectes platessa TaxID=8262 RepID=A0A9N7VZ94_PLEPL|nr:unnamed protein product [Pleuronectes platessa]